MRQRYKIRAHQSGNQDGSTESGTFVLHIGGSTTVEALSIDEVEAAIRKKVAADTIPKGWVYQICPPPESPESLRFLAVALDGSFRECQLEPGRGLYSEFRKIAFSVPCPEIAA